MGRKCNYPLNLIAHTKLSINRHSSPWKKKNSCINSLI